MNQKNKISRTGSTLVGLALLGATACGGTYTMPCTRYRGHSEVEVPITYTFDDQPAHARNSLTPDFVLISNSDLRSKLDTLKSYEAQVEERRNQDGIISHWECEQ
jgi:hypothetical protein